MHRAISVGLLKRRPSVAASSASLPLSEDEWAALCRSQIYPYALRCLGQAQDAEDVAVETYAAALQGSAKFRGDVEPRLWLLGIARRKVADVLRRRSRQGQVSHSGDEELWEVPTDASNEPEVAVLRAEALSELRRLVWDLPALQREALLLQVVEGLSIAEIAQVLGRSPSATNSLLGRARETIRQRGEKYFGGDE
jgi:RNA polymerase sigma-70 factor (ECF subfamily)